jgi:hypothetical protein
MGDEFAGYGHIGRDDGPGDSDCWGCHGFPMPLAPGSGPVIPTVYNAGKAKITAGAAASVVLTGAAFTNTMGNSVYEADVTLTAADGTTVTLTPDVIVDEGMLAVTIPANTPPGNYHLRASKSGFTSNVVAISLVPRVTISQVSAQGGIVTITGAGFGGHAPRSGTSVTGRTADGRNVTGTIISWTDGKIVARFGSLPSNVTVRSVFGKTTSSVTTQSLPMSR